MQIHLDPLGGMAGDMFVAALLDAFPAHEAGVRASVAACLRGAVDCRSVAHADGVLTGRRFLVEGPGEPHGHDAGAGHRHAGDGHPHRHWSAIRDDLAGADLAEAVRGHAVGIFTRLAEAEAEVHGVAVGDVAFHEVGAWDSIADIVAAAHLVAQLDATHWSVGPLPLGSGRVVTAHGPLPVPAPATVILLEGFPTVDDGVPGERVTPTGAAILRYLCDPGAPRACAPRILRGRGFGFGARRLPGISNCVRALVFEEEAPAEAGDPGKGHRELGVIEFEVDDQSAEDLAVGLDRLRAHPAVFDVVQAPVFGKKGRMMTHVRALVRADAVEAAAEACFRETTTIGLRHRVVSGLALTRRSQTVEVGGRPVRVKAVDRPGGRTAKAEADDAAGDTHAARAALRRAAEGRVLEIERAIEPGDGR